MENVYSPMRQLKNNGKLPKKGEINSVFSFFSKWERVVFLFLVALFILSTMLILESINRYFMMTVPFHGGAISEGIVGVPRFINPALAGTEADQALVSLVYSGLMRKNGNDGLILDLAKDYQVSENGLIYTFSLKDNLFFQDGIPLTADDVVFTINKVKESVIESPHKVDWDGVNIEKIDYKTIRFTLKQPYASFLENATIGIMPARLWEGAPLELNERNTNPIGSGPYMINSVKRQSSGIIDNYELVPFKKFTLGAPYIKTINLHFYSNEDSLIGAFTKGEIDQISSITPSNAEILREKNYNVESTVLPRVFGLFFNQNQNRIFTDKNVISAINQLIDKDKIIVSVLHGYGVAIEGPIPPNMIEYEKSPAVPDLSRGEILKKVASDLAKSGWTKGSDGILEKTATENGKKVTTKLQFSISTGNVPELSRTAELIKEDLLSAGINVELKTFEIGNLNQSVIRPRKYDALLFGEIINHESDLFAFWHSSQRKDPGLNVAMYTNAKVDKILEDAYLSTDKDARIKKYIEFSEEIKKDMPAVFLYSPDFIYAASRDLKNFKVDRIISPSDRYANAYRWYTESEDVWRAFVR